MSRPKKKSSVRNSSAKTARSEGLQERLAEPIMMLLSAVIADRQRHHEEHPDDSPNKDSVQSIIKSYSLKNATISGGATLVPGPWGMLAAVPEIVLVLRNQITMIDDIGRAYGKERVITKELIAGILLTALGGSGAALLAVHGEKVLVERVALKGLQQVSRLLAGKITQTLLKSAISKWLPVVGAAAMAAWSNHMTHKIGQQAIKIFEKEIEISDTVQEDLPTVEAELSSSNFPTSSKDAPPKSSIEATRIRALINLMKVDGTVNEEERHYLQTILDQTNLSEKEKEALTQSIESHEKSSVNFEALSSAPDEAIALLIDMVALAQRDSTFHITEKMYIKQAGKLMGFSNDDIEAIMSTGS